MNDTLPLLMDRLTWQRFRRREFGVTARSVHTADLNEASHEHDEGDTHQQHCPPMGLERRTKHKTSHQNTNTSQTTTDPHESRLQRGGTTYHDPLCDVLIELRIEDGLL